MIEPPGDEADPAAAALSDDELDALLDAPDDDPTVEQLGSRRFEAWRRRSAIGVVGTGFAFGLKEIFYPTDDEPVVSAPAPGDPPDDPGRLRVILDPEDPTKSVALLPVQPPESD